MKTNDWKRLQFLRKLFKLESHFFAVRLNVSLDYTHDGLSTYVMILLTPAQGPSSFPWLLWHIALCGTVSDSNRISEVDSSNYRISNIVIRWYTENQIFIKR